MLTIEKQRHESRTYKQACSELSCQSDEKVMIGKLTY